MLTLLVLPHVLDCTNTTYMSCYRIDSTIFTMSHGMNWHWMIYQCGDNLNTTRSRKLYSRVTITFDYSAYQFFIIRTCELFDYIVGDIYCWYDHTRILSWLIYIIYIVCDHIMILDKCLVMIWQKSATLVVYIVYVKTCLWKQVFFVDLEM